MLALNTKQLLAEVESLPLDLKTKLIDKLLSSLNPSQTNIDALWKEEIEKRVADIKSGNVDLIEGKEVFHKIQERFAKLISSFIPMPGIPDGNNSAGPKDQITHDRFLNPHTPLVLPPRRPHYPLFQIPLWQRPHG